MIGGNDLGAWPDADFEAQSQVIATISVTVMLG